MGKYINKFEEAIDNVPYSTNFVEMANQVLFTIVDSFYKDCTYFRTMQTAPINNGSHVDYIRTIVFEVYGQLYLYYDLVRDNDHTECSQLDRIIECDKGFNNVVSLVLFSSDPTAEPMADTILGIYKHSGIVRDWSPELNKE